LNFAPLVWNYLANGILTIDSIYEIDLNFKRLIESLQSALNSNITYKEFEEQFQLNFVIYNSRGEEVPLTPSGRTEKVTLSNCVLFISLATEYRIGELLPNLESMRKGFWENLNFKPPSFVTGSLLEFAACGVKEISLSDLKDVILFSDITQNQKNQFMEVLEMFTPEQRSKFLKFSTGRIRLPSKNIKSFHVTVDGNSSKDRLPTSSTCFNQFHMPCYSSSEKAYQMISGEYL